MNTSGAYIPGHGTPTVLLFGTNEPKQGGDVLAVLAKRGEPSTPADPEEGLVWRSIADRGDEVGFDNEFISVARVMRGTLEKHPWSLGGGGAAELKELLEERAACRLGDLSTSIGIGCVTGEDDLYLLPFEAAVRLGIERTLPMIIGEGIRDWSLTPDSACLFPYDERMRLEPLSKFPRMAQLLWCARSVINRRKRFGTPMIEKGLSWYELQELYADKYRTPLTITFAFVATHNHFVLDRGGKVFKQSAPIIKLNGGATEEDHLALLAYLNSSTACFWMKQVFFDKGNRGEGGGTTAETWEKFFEFDGTKIKQLPILGLDPPQRERAVALARDLLATADSRQAAASPTPLFGDVQSAEQLEELIQSRACEIRGLEGKLRALQEDLDWFWYEVLAFAPAMAASPLLAGGDRAADILFANAVLGGEVGRRYFELCRLPTPDRIVSAPEPGGVATRLRAIRESPELSLIETPTFKRTFREGFRLTDWKSAAREWICSRLESIVQSSVEPLTCRTLLRTARLTTGFAGTLQWTFAQEPTARELVELMTEVAAPYVAAYRLTDPGLEKRAVWERVWDLQRAEDRGEKLDPFDPPPKYDQKDYRDATTWRLRGKLDVPKERFISYPGCESDEDKEPVYGWAGWNHLQQAQALATLYQNRKTGESWGKDRLIPMLAGLLELIPWVKQWHNEPSAEFGGLQLGDYFETFLDGECHALGVTREDLRAWRPKGKEQKRAEATALRVAKAAADEGDEPKPVRKPRRKKADVDAV